MGPEMCTAWFHPGSLKAIGNVTFYHDDDGNWNGEWTMMEDELAQDILDEDLGMELKFELDNLPDIEQTMVSLMADTASVNSFGTALEARANPSARQGEPAIPAMALAVAANGSDGPAT